MQRHKMIQFKESHWGVHNYNDNLNYYVRGRYRDVNKYASSAFYKKIISGKTYPVLYRMLSSEDDWENSHRKGKDSYVFDKDVGDIITFKQLTSTTSKKPDKELIQNFMYDICSNADIDTIVVLKNVKGLPVDYNNKMVCSSGYEIELERFRYQEEVITFGKFRIDRIYEDENIFPGFKTTIYECSTLDQSKELAFNIQKDKYHKIKNDTYNIYENVLNESYNDFDAQTISSYVKNYIKHVKEFECVADFLEDLNEYLEPLQVEIVEDFGRSGYKWITPNIAFASLNEAGCISIEIGADALLQDLIWDRENNYPYEEDTDFNQFLKELGQVIVHECVHAHQYSRGWPNKKWENGDPSEVGMWKYLASNDEVDAHAIAGVQEALDIGYSKKEILDILSGKNKISRAEDLINELNCTTDYYDWFCGSDDPEDQKVVKRLIKVMAREALKEE